MNAKIKIGDSVVVKNDVRDADFPDLLLAGFQGRIIELSEDEDGNELVDIEWDSQSLRGMADYVSLCEEEELDWTTCTLFLDEVEPTEARDTPEDVRNVANELLQSWLWTDLGEQGKRIAAVRGVGFEWKYSVGVTARSFERFEKKTTVELNGQTLELDGIMRGVEILELSFVWEGADPEAHALNLQKGNSMDLEKLKADLRLEFEAQTLQLTALNEALKLENDALKAELQANKDAEAQEIAQAHGIDLAVAMELVGLSVAAKSLLLKKDSKKTESVELVEKEHSAQDNQFAFAMASMKGATK